ncbi:uncharacterized mitochondrial protein-like protein [Tanacetum coccineum]
MELCVAFEKLMHEKFQMSSMRELTFFLELQVKQKKDGIFITQDKYVDVILKKFRFTEVKTASTPMETQKPFLKDEDGEEVDVHMYRSMIGSLMYLISSRPDIMYLKGQPKLGIWYPKDSSFDLVAYTNSDYAGASLDRKSTTGDEAVHKELGDSSVRAATTASSLEAEQDSGNINKTQSKATPNESSSQGTNSGGGPWCQETMGDTIAQTRRQRPLNIIASLKRRVKKLEKKDRSRIHRLKRLYKVGLTARVESSNNEESLGEDASKQGRIDAIDADEEITLVSVHDVNVSAGEEDKGKGILIEPVKPMNKKDLIRLDEETALNLQAEFDEEERLAREKAEKEEEANIALIET